MTPGALLGKYRLLRPLGRGAMGEVWAAVNVDTDREVALKLITSPDPELRRRLNREARAIGRLDHPNIVQILDRGETPQGEPFLVMQLLQGETLGERLQRERVLPEPVAAGIALDIARALRVAHEKEIVHRDLKPANIFLHREPDTEDDVVKVVDFGVSKLAIENEGAATVQGGLVGSPAYMSPEQVRAVAIDGRADIWALGVMLFEMLAGVRPFSGPTSVGVLTQILDPAHVPRLDAAAPQVHRGLCAVVAACLERDLTRRVPSAAELARLLRPFATRGRHATVEAFAARERFASLPEAPPPAPSEPSREVVRESDAETGIFRPSMLLSAALASPQAAGSGTVLIGAPVKPPPAPDAGRDSTVTFWQPGMIADGAHAADESDRVTTEVLKPGVLPSPAAPAAWRRQGTAPSSDPLPRVEPAAASSPHAPAPPDMSPAERKRVFATTQPLLSPPSLGETDLRGATVKIGAGLIAPSGGGARTQWPAPPTLAATTTTAPLAGPPPSPYPTSAAPTPRARRWPLVLLSLSILALVTAIGMLVVTLRDELRGPAPAASSYARSPTAAPSSTPSAAPILASSSASASRREPAPSAKPVAPPRPAPSPAFRPRRDPPF